MSATTHRLRRVEAVELIEVLELVAAVCIGAYSTISAELAWRLDAYDAGDLRADALRLAERVAATNGVARSSVPARTPKPTP